MFWKRWLARRTPAETAPSPEIPREATFRRAVGLELRLWPCRGLDQVRVTAQRQGGSTTTTLSREEARALCALNRWQTAAEAGLSHARLTRLVQENLVYFSRSRPREDLTGSPSGPLRGRMALRRNVWPTPAVRRKDEVGPIPFMPRLGSLRGAELVGVHLGVNEMDKQTHGVAVGCCAEHGALLRNLLWRLNGRHDVESLDGPSRELCALLHDLGLLEPAAPPPSWNGRAQVSWLGHATVLVESAGQRILVDPMFHPRSIPARPRTDTPPWGLGLGPLSAVLITHGDHDHLNPNALYQLDPATPVYLPRTDVKRPYQVDLRALVELLGFTHVHEVDAWERIRLGDVTVVAAPFHGEDWGLTLPCRTYLITSEELTVYLNADSHGMTDVYRKLAQEFRVDLALLGVGGCAESHVMPPGYGYGNFYALWIPAQKRNEWIQLCGGPSDAAEAAELLGARHAFGYAAGGASFIQVAYTDRGTHDELATILKERGARCQPLRLPLGEPVAVPHSDEKT
ncbi:MAG: MBL fold metallo-hydrolase [Myxococcota bacterium]